MSQGFIQLPPDGIGKKSSQSVLLEFDYGTGTIDFKLGDIVSFSVATWSGTIIFAEPDNTTSTGTLHLRVEEPIPATFSLANGEDIIVNGITNAKITAFDPPIYFAQNVIVGHDMGHVAEVDHAGSLHTRYAGGSPEFDAYGRVRYSETTTLGEYPFRYEINSDEWWIEQETNGTVTHIVAGGGVLLSNTIDNASRAAITTHKYHHAAMGISQLIEVTVVIGDLGKDNVDRKWGYGDSTDGVFFKLDGTQLTVEMNSSIYASTIVNQEDWNVDRVNGIPGEFNPSDEILYVDKVNIYWFDIQWMNSVGRVRFGVILNGQRIVCHEMIHGNNLVQPHINTGSLPIMFEQVNTAASGSTSEMRVFGSHVKTEGTFEPNIVEFFNHIRPNERQDGGKYKKAMMNWHPGRELFSIRPALTKNGVTNRIVAWPTQLSVGNEGNSTLWIAARRNPVVVNTPTWFAFQSDSSTERSDDVLIDKTNRGVQVAMWAIPPNSSLNIDLTGVFGSEKEHIILGADGLDQDIFTYVFTSWNMESVVGGSDAGKWTIDFASNTITATAGVDFVVEGFTTGLMLYVRSSLNKQNDKYFIIIGVTSTVLTVEEINGDTTTFISETATANVELQAGVKTLFFGSMNMTEIV